MESLQKTKTRIASVKNINQITKAMELVAATKMRKSQEIALASRPYAYAALDFLANLSKIENYETPPLLQKRETVKTLFVIVASDKGLAGSFNAAVLRSVENYFRKEKLDFSDSRCSFVAVGQKAVGFLRRKKAEIKKTFVKFGDFTQMGETDELAEFLIAGFLEGDWDKVVVFSTNFRSALKQEIFRRQILPVDFEIIKQTIREIIPESGKFSGFKTEESDAFPAWTHDYLIEPSAGAILEKLIFHLVEMQVYHIVLEANASEHAARRVAMKNASENAEKLAGGLTLIYNKSRQAAITREIIEITSGAGTV